MVAETGVVQPKKEYIHIKYMVNFTCMLVQRGNKQTNYH